ncbi:DUF1573 domain-containing protein [Flavobacterium lacus]|jgi:hypothetical protein|uniref:Uncharacterized protein DUF1573 n=1 Tax=Flavobacterium lacus TaxID=1353778 RepID=A0A328X3D4_9FLAO|nr:DUF1573 domain-containing protein [Flavobacterium lacus]RAR49779.1 uncharacterized protein DUF1573 [Flavobacterium lacus]
MKSLKVSLFAIAATVLFSVGAIAQEKKAEVKPTITTTPAAQKPTSPVTWKEVTYDFGDIKKGTPVSHDFAFTNTTKQTVIITNVKASCGCTATNYTKTPVKPGEKATVTATYNAATAGAFSKTVTVSLNENEVPKVLTIKGKVIDTTPVSQ